MTMIRDVRLVAEMVPELTHGIRMEHRRVLPAGGVADPPGDHACVVVRSHPGVGEQVGYVALQALCKYGR